MHCTSTRKAIEIERRFIVDVICIFRNEFWNHSTYWIPICLMNGCYNEQRCMKHATCYYSPINPANFDGNKKKDLFLVKIYRNIQTMNDKKSSDQIAYKLSPSNEGEMGT